MKPPAQRAPYRYSEVMNTLSTLALVALALNVLVLGYCLWKIARIRQFVAKKNARSLSLSKLADLEATLTELLDGYNALLESHKKLRSRIGMRENRRKRANGEIPDPTTDPDGWKRAMRLQLRRDGILK